MTIKSSAVRASLLGAIAAVGLTATQATAQEFPPTTVINIDEMLAGQGIIEIDLNRDDVTDFLVEIIQLPVRPPFEFETVARLGIASLEVEAFPPASFTLPDLKPGQQASEVALIRAVNEDAGIGFDSKLPHTPFASVFQEGDLVGKLSTASEAFLYVNTIEFLEPLSLQNIDFEEFEIVERSFGPFNEDGANGFVGLSLSIFDEEEEGSVTNFGFLEITRGSITVGQQGFQSTPFAPAEIGASAVPLPAPLAFLAVALLGLFGLRRRA